VGGAGPHALARVVRFGDGWMPMLSEPAKLEPAIARLHELARQAGRSRPEVACFGGLDANEPRRSAEQLWRLSEIGVTRFITGGRYTTAAQLCKIIEGATVVRDAMA
jgi:alkanesulfonate monooxygenase SsuD/methylene tetrahydromethanopterin reductase-like flavin-dependent oxidoreductase (luciferase family)